MKKAGIQALNEWSKGKPLRLVMIAEDRQKAKNEWVFPEPESGGPFTSRQHLIALLCKRAKVKKFGLHPIRHLTASILAQADVPMVTIQRILRHKNLMTTKRYIRGLEPVKPTLEILSYRNFRPKSRPWTKREVADFKEAI